MLIGQLWWCHKGPGEADSFWIADAPSLHTRVVPPSQQREGEPDLLHTAFDNSSLKTEREKEKESALAGLLMRRLLCSLTCPHAFLPHHFTALKNKRHESAAYNYPQTCATAPACDTASMNPSFSLLLTAISLPDNKTPPCHFTRDYLTLKNTIFFFATPQREKVWCVHMAVAMKCQDMNKNDVSRSGEESVSTGNHQSGKLWYGWALMNSQINAGKRCGKGSEAWTRNASPAFI